MLTPEPSHISLLSMPRWEGDVKGGSISALRSLTALSRTLVRDDRQSGSWTTGLTRAR